MPQRSYMLATTVSQSRFCRLTTVTRSRLWQTAQRVSTSSLPGPLGSAAAVAAGAPGPKLVKMTVRAAILERHRRAVFEPIEDDGFAQNDAAERSPSDLVVVGRDVPVVSEEHGLCSRSIAAELRDEISGDRLDLIGR